MSGMTDAPCQVWNDVWCGDKPGDEYAVMCSQAATEILWALSGRRYGLCTWTERPCRRQADGYTWYNLPYLYASLMWPALRDQPWIVSCGVHQDDPCSCSYVAEVFLPGVVHSVDTVTVDGVVLDPSHYRLDNGYRLVRTDGGLWPYCQDMNLADTEVGTWSVTFTTGMEPPTVGAMAAGELANELYLSCMNKPCRIPARVTNVTRQGVTFQMIDPQLFLDRGFVGLPMCDYFLTAYNPNHLTSAPTVYSPDVPVHRRPLVP